MNFKNIRFKQLDVFDGLPHNSVSSIIQDNDGFMWFGTRNGLCRYDGYSLVNYFSEINDSTSISNNFVLNLLNDRLNNCIWVATDEGFCRYNYSTNNFTRYEITAKGKSVSIKQFYQLQNGSLLLVATNELYIYNPHTDDFKIFFSDRQEKILNISGIAEDAFNTLWIATDNGLLAYNLLTKKRVSKIPPFPAYDIIRNGRISNLINDKNRRLWISLGLSELYVFDPSENRISKIQGFENNVFRSLETDKAGNTWIGSEHGILVYDNNLNLIHHFEQKSTDLSGLDDNAIYTIFNDKSDNIWVGTYFGGVNTFVEGTQNFTVYPIGLSTKHLSGRAARQIITGKNNSLWIATEDGGLNYLNQNTNEIEHFGLNTKKIKLKTKNIHSLLLDSNDKLWIGTFAQGLSSYDEKTGKQQNYNSENHKFESFYDFCLQEDSDGDIWAGTITGLLLYDKKKDVFSRQKWTEELTHEFVYCLKADENGTLWAGTRKFGLFKVDKKKKTVHRIEFQDKNINFITYLYEDSKQNIWVGSNYGVYILDSNGTIKKNYTVKDGLPSNAIKAIIEDENKIIWLTTDQGLCRLNVKTNSINNFTINDGIPVNQFNYASACLAKNGELFFGTINGMISFFPSSLNKSKNEFNLLFTSIKVNDEPFPIGVVDNINIPYNKIELNYAQGKSFTVEFSGMNFRFGSNTYYATKLEGADNKWQNIGKQHQVNFSNLTHGKYLLYVKAGNDGFTWDEKGMKTLEIIINPPFWLSIWAYLLYLIILGFILYYIYNFSKSRLNLIIKLKAEKTLRVNSEELNQQKINFFTYISHDLKTPLTLILSPLQRMLQNAKSNDEKAKLEVILRNANRMHYLIDELLTLSKIEMKQMRINVRNGDVMTFISEISKIFELVARDRNIDFSIHLPQNTNQEVWFSPSKLERIIYNLLSNAFKYTRPNGMVSLSARLFEENNFTFLEMIIEDSGRGIPKNHIERIFDNYYQVEKTDHYKGFGIGLSLTKSLVTIHKGTIDVESHEGEGTKFIVKINVSENVYDNDQRSTESISNEDIKKYNDHMQETVELMPEYQKQNLENTDDRPALLIVEDNDEMNNYLEEIFTPYYRIIKAYNGKEGYKKVLKEFPDLIISDVMMPVMDGLEFVNLIKKNIATSHIPIILLTAKTDEADYTKGYLNGADAYISKPFNAQNLELLVSNLQKTKISNVERFKQEDEMNVKHLATNPRDEKFIADLVQLINNNIENEDFGITDIINAMGVSRSLLHIKLKSLADASITEFVRSIKMKVARKHIFNGMNISEASFSVGMSDPNYFTKCFKKQFGVTPSELMKQVKPE